MRPSPHPRSYTTSTLHTPARPSIRATTSGGVATYGASINGIRRCDISFSPGLLSASPSLQRSSNSEMSTGLETVDTLRGGLGYGPGAGALRRSIYIASAAALAKELRSIYASHR